ncbi:hypothetical protein RFI_13710 [Reticulomyxa filosa]|uniref:Major facilitator superfamily associated domain-containing protein n=1 Tax=Reticulomyxa filosa TaxID=46433 RepID=X6NDQ8_RETFI|nr:hypothetical protein RFI_13710 [Reticulomyxa filosa]|eukprot:ETO23472.1 hypothetical protein RFI_13710 [Reticulomyxa filosa]
MFRTKLVYFVLFVRISFLGSFLSLFLRSQKLNDSQIGVLLSCPFIVQFLTSGLASYAADYLESRYMTAQLLLGGSSIASIALLIPFYMLHLSNEKNHFIFFFLQIIVIIIYQIPHTNQFVLTDTLVLLELGSNGGRLYGQQRLWGAVSWGLTHIIIGVALDGGMPMWCLVVLYASLGLVTNVIFYFAFGNGKHKWAMSSSTNIETEIAMSSIVVGVAKEDQTSVHPSVQDASEEYVSPPLPSATSPQENNDRDNQAEWPTMTQVQPNNDNNDNNDNNNNSIDAVQPNNVENGLNAVASTDNSHNERNDKDKDKDAPAQTETRIEPLIVALSDSKPLQSGDDSSNSSKIQLRQVIHTILHDRICFGVFSAVFIISGARAVVENMLFVFLISSFGTNVSNLNTLLGVSVCITVIFEIPCFQMSEWLLKRVGYRKMILFGMLCYVIRVLSYTWLTESTLWCLLFIEPLHGITFSMVQIASLHFVTLLFPKQWTATGQGVLGAISSGIGPFLFVFFSGFIMQYLGGDALYRICGSIVAFTIIAFFFVTLPQHHSRPPSSLSTSESKMNIIRNNFFVK